MTRQLPNVKLSTNLSALFFALYLVSLPQHAHAFTAAPLTLKKTSGIFQVSNNADKSLRILVKVFPIVYIDGVVTAGLESLSDEEAAKLIRFRPSGARIRRNGRRNIKYKILKTNVPFYLCALNPTETLLLRICSAWKAPSE